MKNVMLRFGIVLLALCAVSVPAMAQDGQAGPTVTEKTPSVLDNPRLVQEFQKTITADDLAAHLYLFASDLFEGRETTAPGQKLAARYLAAQYQRLGLTPAGTAGTDPRDPNSYFQPFPLLQDKLKSMSMVATKGGATIAESRFSASRADGNAFVQMGGPVDGAGGVVFAGYGIADDDLGYNDYTALTEAGIEIGNKWLIVLADEPMKDAETTLLKTADGELSKWSKQWWQKLTPAFAGENRPLGVLVVADLSPRFTGTFQEKVESTASGLAKSVGSLSLPPDEGTEAEPRRRRGFGGALFQVSAEFASKLLGQDVASLQAAINSSMKPTVMEAMGVSLHATVENESKTVTSENVVAVLEGTDLKDEYVVVTSHYDHVGMAATPNEDGDYIFNGADDDGSGTVTVLEIAEAFVRAAEQGYRPRRSIVFMNVTGEEKGLLGSAYYTDKEPLFPIEKTVTNLNIDMVGRYDPTHPDADEKNYVYIIGSKLISQELHDLNAAVNEITETDLILHERFNDRNDPNRFYARSDHWNFGKNNIPFIFFFTGTHEDYHGLDDEPEKIEYDRMAQIGRMIFATAWQVANQDAIPAVSGEGFN